MDSFEGTCILVVEDEVSLQSLLQKAFEIKGALVKVAKSKDEAISICQTFDPKLVICDYHLENCKGINIVSEIQKTKSYEVITIMITGDVTVTHDELHGKGICALLHKPFRFETLSSTISKSKQNLEYFKKIMNTDARRFYELKMDISIDNVGAHAEFIECMDHSFIVSLPNGFAAIDAPCKVRIKNFLNDEQLEFLIDGKVIKIEEEGQSAIVEISVEESFLINWTQLKELLNEKQKDIMEIIRKTIG
jgi:CheY-like chemotaxis protein